MRKRVIIGIVALVVICGGFIAKYIFVDQSVVSFQVAQGITRVDILRTSNSQKVASITKSGDVRLSHDGYYVVPVGDGLSSDPITFVSPSDATVIVDPDYSSSRLSVLATSILPRITTLLNEAYPTVMPEYSIQKFTAYEKGAWAGGLLVRKGSTQNDTRDMYRFVVHNESGEWTLIGYPDIILTKMNNSAAPSDVLLAIDGLDYDLPN